MHTTLSMIHICGAVVGLLSGFMAMTFRKGSGLHGAAGSVFFVSMPHVLVAGALLYWLARVSVRKRAKRVKATGTRQDETIVAAPLGATGTI